jgi:hypothetical protein
MVLVTTEKVSNTLHRTRNHGSETGLPTEIPYGREKKLLHRYLVELKLNDKNK